MSSNKIGGINSNINHDKALNALKGSSLPPSSVNFDNILSEVFQQNTLPGAVDNNKAPVHNFNAMPRVNYLDDSKDIERLFAQGAAGQAAPNIFEEVERRRRDRRLADQIAQEEAELTSRRYTVTPFQMFIDKSVEVLGNISKLDYRVNDLTEKFMRGEVSIDEVSFEINKLNLAITFATTVISSASQTLKELTQLQI